MSSQNLEILSHLKEFGSIEPKVAWGRLGVCRLASSILELRQSGHRIETVMQKNADGKRFARYIYRGETLQGGKS